MSSINGWNGQRNRPIAICRFRVILHAAVAPLAPEHQADRQEVNDAVRAARDPNAQFRWVYENGDRLETFRSEVEGEAWCGKRGLDR
jgi:hypothetical protein